HGPTARTEVRDDVPERCFVVDDDARDDGIGGEERLDGRDRRLGGAVAVLRDERRPRGRHRVGDTAVETDGEGRAALADCARVPDIAEAAVAEVSEVADGGATRRLEVEVDARERARVGGQPDEDGRLAQAGERTEAL